ncbi:MAG: hypothetical protein A2Y40_09895 [Candidatus Margulisbacteria bacterium GWF2_35_9]|nr:MAG: hypothetical protein A2Y40_09895 [Candidatus Margulisbacteria bacterium GWF2_35_9]
MGNTFFATEDSIVKPDKSRFFGYVVDDFIDTANLIKNTLAKLNINILGVSNDYNTCLDYIQSYSENLDFVTLDINIKRHNGLDLIPEIKMISEKIKIFVISANPSPANLNKAKDFGASAFIIKPWFKDDFISTFRQILLQKEGSYATRYC